jgi:hypothetical protein
MSQASAEGSEQDWRLEVELEAPGGASALHGLVARLRGRGVAKEIEASVPSDVVITHDGHRLFAYASDERALSAARSAIEQLLRSDGVEASVRVSHWDDELDVWRQTDPPPEGQDRRAEDAFERDAETVETRTLVASAGKLIRSEFEQTMREWAQRLGLQCQIVEHPHLLTTQVAFTVKGPRRKIDEFVQGLRAEGLATMRTETAVMLSPL